MVTLDYIDLRNYCKTNKINYNICLDNKKIKQLLSYRTTVIFPSYMNIANILSDFYNQVIHLITTHYTYLPRWVNKELFMIDFTKQLVEGIIDVLAQEIEYDYDYKNHQLEKNFEGKALKLKIPEDWISFALVSNQLSVDLEENIKDYTIYLSSDFMDYIIYGIENTIQINNYRDLYNLLSNLVFIKFTPINYT